MASLQIPDHLEEQLAASAMRRGQSKEELIEEIVSIHLEEESPAQESFSPDQIARFRQSIAQLDRGEVVASEQVDARFNAFFKRLAAR